MKRILVTILIILSFHPLLSAQGIAVESFELLPTDLTAIMRETQEIDQNGEVAALIKMVTTQTGFVLDGGMMGIVKTKQDVAELWIYVPHGIRRIVIKHQQLGQLEYYFPIPIEKGRTYKMVLTTDELITIRRPRQGVEGDSLAAAVARQQADDNLAGGQTDKSIDGQAGKQADGGAEMPSALSPSDKSSAPKRHYRHKHFSFGGGILDDRLTGENEANAASLGFYVQADYDLPLVGPLSIRPGARFCYNTEENEHAGAKLFFADYNADQISSIRWTNSYFDILLPLALNFRLGRNFAVGLYGGPMLCFGQTQNDISYSMWSDGSKASFSSSGFYFMLTCGLTLDLFNTVRITAGYDPGTYYRQSVYSQKIRRSCLHAGISILF